MALLGPLALRRVPRVLSIAGTDPTGGAGIHADLKSIAAMGGYGMAVVTALVAQNTRGVRSVHTPPTAFLREQLDAVSDDVVIDAVKIGMLGDVATIEVVHEWLLRIQPQLVVLDPVMIATSGDRLLADSAEASMRGLVGTVNLVTPNLPELAVLVGEPVATHWPEALDQARRLTAGAGTAVLVKGGHLLTDSSPDALVDAAGGAGETLSEFCGPRVATSNTHGTGCSLSAAVATVMAQVGDWGAAISEVKGWLQGALTYADELEVGEGSGPINHFHHLWTPASPGQ